MQRVSEGGDDALRDAERFGVQPSTLGAISRALDARELHRLEGFAGVLAVNLPVVTAFLSVAGQWRTVLVASGHGMRTRFLGLDYAAVVAGLAAGGTLLRPALWEGLQVMEEAALTALNGEKGDLA